MSQQTNIEWCDATFNPWIGCTAISPGCQNCYAEAQMDKRLQQVNWGAGNPRKRTSAANWKQPLRWNKLAQKGHFVQCTECGKREFRKWDDSIPPGGLSFCSNPGCLSLSESHSVRARPRVFCSSLADVFDNEVDQLWREDLWTLIESTPNLDWLLLTKRVGNVKEMVPSYWLAGEWPSHVWLGATVVNQEEAERDIPKLLDIPAAIKFVSIEPMLGPIDLTAIERTQSPGYFGDCLQWYHQPHGERNTKWQGIDWVICGGESGPNARPMRPYWVRTLRNQCYAADVPFLFKQWGEWAPNCFLRDDGTRDESTEWMERMGKKSAGRLLDGEIFNQFPGDKL